MVTNLTQIGQVVTPEFRVGQSNDDGRQAFIGPACTGVTPLLDKEVAFLPHHYALTLVSRDCQVDDTTAVTWVRQILTAYLAPEADPHGETWSMYRKGNHGYRQLCVGPFGARVSWDPVALTAEGRRHLQLEIKGSCCDQLTLGTQRELMDQLNEVFSIRCTRVDLAFDTRKFTTQLVWENCKAKNLRVHFPIRMGGPDPKKDSIRREMQEGVGGTKWTTVYLGSRSSQRMARLYDRRGYMRCELELKDERADRVFTEILRGPAIDARVPVLCMGVLRDFVDFVDRSAAVGAAAPLLPWWASFVGSVPALRMPEPPQELDADRTRAWLLSDVAPSIAAVANREPDPIAFVIKLYQEGNKRQTARHRRLTAQPRSR